LTPVCLRAMIGQTNQKAVKTGQRKTQAAEKEGT
jgi:hypothetical protein